MITREQIIEEAISWLDTPYHHKACVKNVGVDCAMLVAGIAANLGIINMEDIDVDYSTQWHLHMYEEKLVNTLEKFDCWITDDLKPGDIMVFKYGKVSSHLGILINTNQVIHARQDIGKVVINDLTEDLLDRWSFTYKFPGVDV